MDKSTHCDTATQDRQEPVLCWREILQTAFGGVFPSDHQLDSLMDHYESLS